MKIRSSSVLYAVSSLFRNISEGPPLRAFGPRSHGELRSFVPTMAVAKEIVRRGSQSPSHYRYRAFRLSNWYLKRPGWLVAVKGRKMSRPNRGEKTVRAIVRRPLLHRACTHVRNRLWPSVPEVDPGRAWLSPVGLVHRRGRLAGSH